MIYQFFLWEQYPIIKHENETFLFGITGWCIIARFSDSNSEIHHYAKSFFFTNFLLKRNFKIFNCIRLNNIDLPFKINNVVICFTTRVSYTAFKSCQLSDKQSWSKRYNPTSYSILENRDIQTVERWKAIKDTKPMGTIWLV